MARLKKRCPLLVLAGTLIVAIVSIALLSPGLVGRFAERALSGHVELARRETQGITIRSEYHERRWFRSQSRQRVEIVDPELETRFRELLNLDADAQTPDLLIDTRIDHGPIPFTSLAHEHGSLVPGLARSVSNLSLVSGDADSIPLPARMTGALGFGGTFAALLRIEAGSTTAEGPIVGPVEDPVENDTASWSNIDLTFDIGTSGGGFELSFDSLEAGDAGGRYALGPIAIAGNAEASRGRVDMRFRAGLHIDEAPGIDASRIDVEARLDGVDGAGLADLRNVVEAVASEADDAVALAAMEDEILAVLAAGLEFRLDRLDIEVPRGRTEMRVSLTMASSDAVDYDWSSALEAMACDAELSVSEAAVEAAMQTNESIVAAVGTGFLKKDGEVYRMRVKCSNGLMTVNGAPLPLQGVIP